MVVKLERLVLTASLPLKVFQLKLFSFEKHALVGFLESFLMPKAFQKRLKFYLKKRLDKEINENFTNETPLFQAKPRQKFSGVAGKNEDGKERREFCIGA